MSQTQSSDSAQRVPRQEANRRFAIGVSRAFGGAIIFSLPMLMTMEMWWLGFYMHPGRLALFLAAVVPLLIGLSYYVGFQETTDWREDVLDAFVAYAVGFAAAAVVLPLMGIIEAGMSNREIIGKIALQAVPGSIGALLAQSQLANSDEHDKVEQQQAGYFSELFLMVAGALFLAFNLAPTEEMVLIAYKMTSLLAIVLALLSLLLMHAFVFAMEFDGQEPVPPGTPVWKTFLRFTVVGYAISLLISLFVLWIFGRTDGAVASEIVMMTIVLGFPSAIGAAAARLIL